MIDSIACPVRGFAELALLTLRANGVSDAEILATYTGPDPEADASMEAAQVAETGIVYAPAADVKAMMRLLMLDAGQTVQ